MVLFVSGDLAIVLFISSKQYLYDEIIPVGGRPRKNQGRSPHPEICPLCAVLFSDESLIF
jgi:hypothetical protein